MLNRTLAGHVVLALRAHRKRLAREGHLFPSGIFDLEKYLESVAKGEVSPSVTFDLTDRPPGSYAGPDGYLTQRAAARALGGVHPRTVSRMLNRGELEPVIVAGKRRVSRASVDALLNRHRDAVGARSPGAAPSARPSQLLSAAGRSDDFDQEED